MTVKFPDVSVSLVSGNVLVQNTPQKVLLVGQSNGGTAVSGSLTENIQNDLSENGFFGSDSMLSEMVRNFKAINKLTQVDAIALGDNGGAVAAAGLVTFGGAATESGTITVIIGSAQNYSFDIAVTSGDSADDIGTALEAAVTANSNVPVTASNAAGVVTITAKNAGTYGNSFTLSVSGIVAGVTQSITGMTGGATDPVLTSVFDVIGENRYQAIIWPYDSDFTELTTLLDGRFNVVNNVLDGVGFSSSIGSFSTVQSLVNGEDSQSLVVFLDKTVTETAYAGSSIQEIPIMTAVQFAAIRALRLTDGASVSQFVTATNGALDSFGGAALASKPYANTPFSLLPTIATGRGWTTTEAEQLKTAGGTRLGNNTAGNSIIADELVTTYKTDSAGAPDITFRFLNSVDTSSNIREFYVNNYRARFAQSRLTEGAIVPGRDIVNKEIIEAFSTQLYTELSEEDFVLTQAGEEQLQFYNDNLSVSLDLSVGKATIQMDVPIVSQLRDIVATITILFSTQG